MSTKRPVKRDNWRSFPGYTEPAKRAPGSQANKDDSKRLHQANKRRSTVKLRAVQKASRIANRKKR